MGTKAEMARELDRRREHKTYLTDRVADLEAEEAKMIENDREVV